MPPELEGIVSRHQEGCSWGCRGRSARGVRLDDGTRLSRSQVLDVCEQVATVAGSGLLDPPSTDLEPGTEPPRHTGKGYAGLGTTPVRKQPGPPLRNLAGGVIRGRSPRPPGPCGRSR